ncbi:uncharacterized protein LOC131440026 [Malaya genurostris]|uniref:uncharacterized protein LOC131440026 n=1 Tax=Malaya genurostris TaxID=325434 RepID=UPI0026F3A75C|nr:uncharacterized protein LOC131440026 [Malaya genurostris]
MPSAEPPMNNGDEQQSSSLQDNRQHDQNGHGDENDGNHILAESNQTVSRDPDRQLIPADRILHVEDCPGAPLDLPTVREFTQNDKINKFLLNSFLQLINETDLEQVRDNDTNGDSEQDQDFEA